MTIDLDHLEAAAKAATPGPWKDMSNHPDHLYGAVNKGNKHIALCNHYESAEPTKTVTVEEMRANAAFIAAVNPAVVFELVAEVRRHRKSMTRLARTLRNKNRALAIAQRECKYAQERATRVEQELEEWKQAAVLRWTTSVPNRAGWYWNRVAGKEALPMRLYYDSDGAYCYQVAGIPDECWLVESLNDEVGCEWAGPIPEPKEPE